MIEAALLLLSWASFSSQAFNQPWEGICSRAELGSQLVLSEGRVTTFRLSSARLRDSLFSPTPACKQIPAESLICVLSLGGASALAVRFPACDLSFKANHEETFRALALSKRGDRISPDLAVSQRMRLNEIYHQLSVTGQSTDGFGTDLGALLARVDKWNSLVSGNEWWVRNSSNQWVSVHDAIESQSLEKFEQDLFVSNQRATEAELRVVRIDEFYEAFQPFTVAIGIVLLAFLGSLGSFESSILRRATVALIGLSILIETAGVAFRIAISGRAPVTNMYETVLWVGLCCLVLASALGWRIRNFRLWSAGLAVNLMGLFMMKFARQMLDGTIQPLVPVLRDNFWLSTHVTSVTTSYACFAFSWILANGLILYCFVKPSADSLVARWNGIIRMSIQIGTILLALGILLGGIWADYSWGRFWGWDPKETWSLIALIIYIGILHGRYVGWFAGIQFTRMAALGFLSILMAWFGVNFILATGLHTYGFSSGGAVLITTLVGFQLLVVLFSSLKTAKGGPVLTRVAQMAQKEG